MSGAAVTTGLIAACTVVFAVQLCLQVIPLSSRTTPVSLSTLFGFLPSAALSQPWRFLTTAFLHGSPFHLAFNMWALWVLGTALEPVLGRWRYTVVLLLSALGGSTMIYLLSSPSSPSWRTLTVGASGAVFGLFATMFVVQRRLGRDTSQILGLLAVNALVSVFGVNISWQGHLGGLLVGGLVAAAFAWAPRDRRGAYSVLAAVGTTAVMVVLVVLRGLMV